MTTTKVKTNQSSMTTNSNNNQLDINRNLSLIPILTLNQDLKMVMYSRIRLALNLANRLAITPSRLLLLLAKFVRFLSRTTITSNHHKVFTMSTITITTLVPEVTGHYNNNKEIFIRIIMLLTNTTGWWIRICKWEAQSPTMKKADLGINWGVYKNEHNNISEPSLKVEVSKVLKLTTTVRYKLSCSKVLTSPMKAKG